MISDINPILKTDYPDPDVIRVEDTYYMISTTMYYMPGGVILKSYDLVNWEIVTYVFDKLDGSDEECLKGDLTNYGKGMWAPTLRYHDGRFYVAFVSHGRADTHLFIADAITGPWEHRYINEYFHDCSLLFDDDGRTYIVSGNTDIRVVELNDEMTGIREGGVDAIVIRDDKQAVNLGYEGAHIYKINGKYVITLIHWPKYNSRRTEAVFVSDRIDGEYVGADVMWDDLGYHNMGVAQGGLVTTPEGTWYAILFQDSGAVGRVPVLVPVHIDDCGDTMRFVYGENGIIPRNPQVVSTRPDYKYEPLYTSKIVRNIEVCTNQSQIENKDVSILRNNTGTSLKPRLMPAWQWNHLPDDDLWDIGENDSLRIRTGKISINPIHAINTLTQRMMLPSCSAKVTVDAKGLNNGDTAGLIALEGCYAMLGVRKEDDRFYLVKLVREEVQEPYTIGYPDLESAKIKAKILLNTPVITVKLMADFTDMTDKLKCIYVHDGIEELIDGLHQMKFGLDHFTGVRFGMCVYSTSRIGGEAIFSEFRYEYPARDN